VVSRNEPIQLKSIYFDYDDDKILPDAEKDLAYLKSLMDKYPDMVIELSSHTDSRGDNEYNKKLSQRRANSTKNWLVEEGIAATRIKAVGYGELKLLNRCKDKVKCTEEEHQINRRSEFKIIAGPQTIEIKADN
jgi:outer membrane protein OmpA-like peptidoglycan-associated protein